MCGARPVAYRSSAWRPSGPAEPLALRSPRCQVNVLAGHPRKIKGRAECAAAAHEGKAGCTFALWDLKPTQKRISAIRQTVEFDSGAPVRT